MSSSFSLDNLKKKSDYSNYQLKNIWFLGLTLNLPVAQQWAMCILVPCQDQSLQSWSEFPFLRSDLPYYFHIHLETFPSSPQWHSQKFNNIERIRKGTRREKKREERCQEDIHAKLAYLKKQTCPNIGFCRGVTQHKIQQFPGWKDP